jgi:hypothetical protein
MMSSSFLNPCFLKVLCELYLLVQWTLTNPNSLGLEGIDCCKLLLLCVRMVLASLDMSAKTILFLCEVELVEMVHPRGWGPL